MSKLEKVYIALTDPDRDRDNQRVDTRVNILVTILFLGLMLSIPLGRLSSIIWFTLYPIIACTYLGLSFSRILFKSLYILPLLIVIGIFNPIFDKQGCLNVGGYEISYGWLTFCSILIRGLLSLQALLILIDTSGFIGLCRGLRRLGVPSFLTDQLLFIYRYMSVLIYEALTMQRARQARGFGKKNFPVKLWGVMIGQLFLRTIDRAEKVNRAMLARGFNGSLPPAFVKSNIMRSSDWIYLIVSAMILLFLRFYDLSQLFVR